MIELSSALKEGIAETLSEMLRAQKTDPGEIVGFPTVKVSFAKPDGVVFKLLKREDFPNVIGLEDREIYVYQEA